MLKHSKIGASSAKRWMACPGSVRLSDSAPRRSSDFAQEGTAAHALAEKCLRHDIGESALARVGETYEGVVVTTEMAEAVNVYLNACHTDYEPGDEIDIEVRFALNDIHPGLFGTADRVRYRPSTKTLRVTDYKHGAGVAVEVEDNPQLLYYALGAVYQLRGRGVRTVEIEVVQPRCPHPDGPVRLQSIDIAQLIDFSADLYEAAVRTENPGAPLDPGAYCRWCPAAGFCPAIASKAQALAKTDFALTTGYSPGDLSEILETLPQITQWVKSVNEFAYAEAQAGRIPPGYKLVQKRATRKWRDDDKARELLTALGLPLSDINEPISLKSVTDIEKTYGKKNMKDLAEVIVQESSGTALAPLTDSRPAIAKATAKEDFAALDYNSEDNN